MRLLLLPLLCAATVPAFAQPPSPPAPSGQPASGQPASGRPTAPEGWSIGIGVAPIFSPAWQGSKDMALSVFPDLRLSYGDLLFASVPEGIGLNAINRDGWRAGPLVKIRFGRNEDDGGSPFQITGGSDALIGMGDIKVAGEAGGFVEHSFGPRQQWRARAEVRQGFGGHDGLLADLSLNHRSRIGRTIISAGPRASFASRDFMQTYFGVSPAQSLRTGLAPYRADGGPLSYGVGGTVIRPLDRNSALTLFTSLERLGDPAGDSPLVRERGRRTQFTLGLGYSYRFGL